MSYVYAVLFGFGLPPLIALAYGLVFRYRAGSPRYFMTWMWSAAGGFIGGAVSGIGWFACACSAASAVLAFILWWWSRRKRKRSPKALGHKARARLAAMIRNMPKPGPALRPVPQGVPS
jgi:membrane protein implicated in regulation of membrane protease activity